MCFCRCPGLPLLRPRQPIGAISPSTSIASTSTSPRPAQQQAAVRRASGCRTGTRAPAIALAENKAVWSVEIYATDSWSRTSNDGAVQRHLSHVLLRHRAPKSRVPPPPPPPRSAPPHQPLLIMPLPLMRYCSRCLLPSSFTRYMVQSFGKWVRTLSSGCYCVKANPTPNPKLNRTTLQHICACALPSPATP
jgi:hypothetical protein